MSRGGLVVPRNPQREAQRAADQASRAADYAEFAAKRERAVLLAGIGNAVAQSNQRASRIERAAQAEIARLTAEIDTLRTELITRDEALKDMARTMRFKLAALELSTAEKHEQHEQALSAVATLVVAEQVTKSKPRRTRQVPVRDPKTQRILHIDTIEIPAGE